jgi:catechol 2,3-dioxygenase-like lactoylglutathione lyase family enzyme
MMAFAVGAWRLDERRATRSAQREEEPSMLGDHPVFPILLSRDLERSRAFYGGLLGLEVVRRDEDRIVFRCGGGTQLVVTLSTTGTADTQTQLAWRVPDLRAELTELRDRGVRVEAYGPPDPVTDADGVADMGHSWAAWIIDPDGNALGIVEPKAPAAARP